MIGRILPPQVCWSEAWHDEGADELFPEERAVVARAVDERRAEFATVRRCARDALGRLGHAPVPLLPGDRGAPRWPPGVVGSMTHCGGYRAAAVARSSDVVALGIDAEPCRPLPDGVLEVASCLEERRGLRRLPVGEAAWDRVLFSAKESVCKAWFPSTGVLLDFPDVTLSVHLHGTFTARVAGAGPVPARGRLSTVEGRWLVEAGLVTTAAVLLT